jgi:hypothetical protein
MFYPSDRQITIRGVPEKLHKKLRDLAKKKHYGSLAGYCLSVLEEAAK